MHETWWRSAINSVGDSRELEKGTSLMNVTLAKALGALVPTCILFAGSAIMFFRQRAVFSFLQLLGAGCLVLVVLTHVCEALHLLAWMNWGRENSIGHYFDLFGAVLGLTLFPLGYLFHAFASDRHLR